MKTSKLPLLFCASVGFIISSDTLSAQWWGFGGWTSPRQGWRYLTYVQDKPQSTAEFKIGFHPKFVNFKRHSVLLESADRWRKVEGTKDFLLEGGGLVLEKMFKRGRLAARLRMIESTRFARPDTMLWAPNDQIFRSHAAFWTFDLPSKLSDLPALAGQSESTEIDIMELAGGEVQHNIYRQGRNSADALERNRAADVKLQRTRFQNYDVVRKFNTWAVDFNNPYQEASFTLNGAAPIVAKKQINGRPICYESQESMDIIIHNKPFRFGRMEGNLGPVATMEVDWVEMSR